MHRSAPGFGAGSTADGVGCRSSGESCTVLGPQTVQQPPPPEWVAGDRGAHPGLPGLRCHSLRATSLTASPAGLMSAYGDIWKPLEWVRTLRDGETLPSGTVSITSWTAAIPSRCQRS